MLDTLQHIQTCLTRASASCWRAGRPAFPNRAVRVAAIGLMALAWSVGSGTAVADVIVTTNGHRITGTVIEETTDLLRVRTTKGALVSLPRDIVESVTRDEVSVGEAEGDLALSRGEHYRAKRAYERVLKEGAGSDLLAEKLERAETLITNHENAQFDGTFEEALKASRSKQYEKAIELLATILERAPADGPYAAKSKRAMAYNYFQESLVLRDRVEYGRAIRAMESAVKTDPDLAIAHLELARQTQRYSKNNERARECYKTGVGLAHGFFAMGQEEQTTYRELEPEVARLDREGFNAYRYDYAALQFFMGEKLEAANAFLELLEEEAIAADTKDRMIEYIVDAYTDQNVSMDLDHEKVLAQLDKALELNPRTYKAWMLKGRIFLAADQYMDAVEAFGKAIDIEVSVPGLHRFRAQAYLGLNENDLARHDLEQELTIRNTYAVRCELGRVLLLGSDYDEALEQYGRGIKMEPERTRALLGRARTYRVKAMVAGVSASVKKELLGKAEKDIKTVLKKNEEHLEATLEKGQLHQCREEYEEAEEHFGRVIKAFEDKGEGIDQEERDILAEAYTERGEVALAQGNKNRAKEDFEKSLDIRPLFAPAYNLLGQVAELQGQFEEAEAQYRKAIETDPVKPDYEMSLAILFHKHIKEYDKAVDHYRRYERKGGRDLRVADWIKECRNAREAAKREAEEKVREAEKKAKSKAREERREKKEESSSTDNTETEDATAPRSEPTEE